MTQNPYKQGMEAQNAGKPIAANPYAKGRTDWTRWRGGWQYARQLKMEQLLAATKSDAQEVSA